MIVDDLIYSESELQRQRIGTATEKNTILA